MGLLKDGKPLDWEASKKFHAKVKHLGVQQFIAAYNANHARTDPQLKWGDEVEYTVVTLDAANRRAVLSLNAPSLIAALRHDAHHTHPEGSSVEVNWAPEYANWQVEGTPGVPYRVYTSDLDLVERNMALRRKELEKVLRDDQAVVCFAVFPRLGAEKFIEGSGKVFGKVARSLYISDEVINPHPRFATLTRNIRTRRGRKVEIRLPVFQDLNTPPEFPVLSEELRKAVENGEDVGNTADDFDTAFTPLTELLDATTDTVDLDCMAFGMGCSCLQVTLQGRDINESRHLYDQLAVLAPIMLAITAASPAYKGVLLDTDVRWNVIAAMVDDRTEEESDGRIAKSRYDSIDCYISRSAELDSDLYNDIPVAVNQEAFDTLRREGIDELLAQHIAHLFIRDPLVIYDNDFDESEHADPMLHFENIQSTNWNTVRFKPPAPRSNIGWRTEFRSMEVQLTDFENAAFSIFIVLISRVILAFDLNLYMPMSQVDHNMATAHERGAAKNSRFYFRRNIFKKSASHPPDSFVCTCGHVHSPDFAWPYDFACKSDPNSTNLMTLDEIFNGRPLSRDGSAPGFAFPGLIPLIRGYLSAIDMEPNVRDDIHTYLNFISDRASGKLLTTAAWMRAFVLSHPKYNKDSLITEEICYDLVQACHKVSKGETEAPDLLGTYRKNRHGSEVEASVLRVLREAPTDGSARLVGASLSQSAVNSAMERIVKGHEAR